MVLEPKYLIHTGSISPEPRLFLGGLQSLENDGKVDPEWRWDQVRDEIGPLEEEWSPTPKLISFPV